MSNKTSLNKLKIAAIQFNKEIKELSKNSLQNHNDIYQRLKKIPGFETLSLDEIQKKLPEITLTQCRLLIAKENGYSKWSELLEANKPDNENLTDEDLLYVDKYTDGFLNVWFATYDEAKAYQNNRKECFLFPYKHTYFVCPASYIENLGVDPRHSDWELIGRDWAKPKDTSAQVRLRTQLKQARK